VIVFRNVIAECCDGRITTRHDEPTKLVLHRISFATDDGGRDEQGRQYLPDVQPIPDEELDGPAVAARFADRRLAPKGAPSWTRRPGTYTGGEMPYTFLARTDGIIDQCLPVRELAPHARRWNTAGLSLAAAGDFRRRKPTPAQLSAVVYFSALWWAAGLQIVGHTELPDASTDPTKRCPGEHLAPNNIRLLAHADRQEIGDEDRARRRLLQLGVVF